MLAPSIAAQSSDLENSLPRRAANIDFASDLTLLKASADRGLSWLAAQQQDNGSWPGHVGHKQSHSYRVIIWSDSQGRKGDGHLGVTSLAGLAFLAGGHLPDRGKYGDVVRSTHAVTAAMSPDPSGAPDVVLVAESDAEGITLRRIALR